MRCLLLLNAFAIMAAGAYAVLSGDGQRGTGGYRYNGPAHKYLPPAIPPSVEPANVITSPSSTASNDGYKYQESPANHYLPASITNELSPNQLTNYDFSSSVPTTQRPVSAAYNNGYNNFYDYQQTQKLPPIAVNYVHGYQQHTQPQQQTQQEHKQMSYYVSKSPAAASIQDQREAYYVPSSPAAALHVSPSSTHRDYYYYNNKYNGNNNNAGYRYNTPQTVDSASSGYGYNGPHVNGYRYERPTIIDNEQYYGTPIKEIISYQQYDNSHNDRNNFQTSDSTGTPIGASGTNPVTANVAQTFGLPANAPGTANFQRYNNNDITQSPPPYNNNNNEQQQQQQQQQQRITLGSNDYLQMQSNSFELPAYYGHGQQVAPHQQPQQQPQQQQQSAQSSYFSQGKSNVYAPPSLEFQPPYY